MKLKVALHPTQQQVWDSQSRYKVLCAGRRWGKSSLATKITTYNALNMEPGPHWIVTPTYPMARDIYWKAAFVPLLNSPMVVHKNKVDLEVTLVNGATISLLSADNPDRLVGVGLRSLVMDEVAKIRNWDIVWTQNLRPTLTDFKAPAMFISTPQGYHNHFYDMYNTKDPDFSSFHFTSYDNPYIDRLEIDKARNEMDEDAFAQEYLAEFKKFSGLVYKDFSREKHVVDPIELQQDWIYYRAIDFGFINPSAVIFGAVDSKGVLYIYDEVYKSRVHTPDLANLISQKSSGRMFTNTMADSAQASDISELNEYGISAVPVEKTSHTSGVDWITFRIRKITELLRSGRIKIFSNCTNLIQEFESYQYTEVNKNGIIYERPMKLYDHALDALSYMVVDIPSYVEPTFVDKSLGHLINELPQEDFEGFY